MAAKATTTIPPIESALLFVWTHSMNDGVSSKGNTAGSVFAIASS
jgi:hypothetical protein